MGYGNYNDYGLSPLRGLAQGHQKRGHDLSRQATNENISNRQQMSKSLGHPGLSGLMADADAQYTPTEIAMNDAYENASQAFGNAISSEQANVQDRQMDLAENNLAMQSADRRYAAELQNDATKYTADASRIPGFNSMSNNGNPLQGLYANAPNINLFNKAGQRIGGSYSS